MPIRGLTTLRETFEFMRRSDERGVKGIYRICCTKEHHGDCPVRLITALTHGCETNGLEAFRYLINHQDEIAERLDGDVLLVVNNLRAAENYFAGKKHPFDGGWYWCDTNMNRLPRNALSRDDDAYEMRRLHELYPWYKEATTALDIHALPKRGGGMVLDIKGPRRALDRMTTAISVPVRVRNVVKIQRGVPISFFYGGLGRNIPVIETESGVLHTKRGCEIARRTAMDFLFPEKRHRQKIYEIFWALRFPSIRYRATKVFHNFEKVRKGQLLAEGPRKRVHSPGDGYAFFTRTRTTFDLESQIRGEIIFLARSASRR